ncbi:MAG: MBL fold metallo-hydrolase [Methylococcales bacterium]|jgi:ribonuclease BN (tRNA processing enzyme)|nr:MBL fold metallo-hydrolase [Methylococcales bacterium]MBT7444190.1 MBL fold metallo-hydrolase [Methylococcales bacterium]
MKKLLAIAFLCLQPFAATVAADSCEASRVKLQMLGTQGPELWNNKASSSYLVWLDNKARVVIDAGFGSVQNFEASGAQFNDLQAILISHFHADHSADLPAYIKGGYFENRQADLTILGPAEGKVSSSATQFVARLFGNKGVYPYLAKYLNGDASYQLKPVDITLSKAPQTFIESNGIKVTGVSTHHGIFPAVAYRVDAAGCSLVFSGDMNGDYETLPLLAKDADILVAHNAVPENATGVAAALHMKPSKIGEIAQKAMVKTVLMTHLMKRTMGVKTDTLNHVKANFMGRVIFPQDRQVFKP